MSCVLQERGAVNTHAVERTRDTCISTWDFFCRRRALRRDWGGVARRLAPRVARPWAYLRHRSVWVCTNGASAFARGSLVRMRRGRRWLGMRPGRAKSAGRGVEAAICGLWGSVFVMATCGVAGQLWKSATRRLPVGAGASSYWAAAATVRVAELWSYPLCWARVATRGAYGVDECYSLRVRQRNPGSAFGLTRRVMTWHGLLFLVVVGGMWANGALSAMCPGELH